MFQWNKYGQVQPRRSVCERPERPVSPDSDIEEHSMEFGVETPGHDSCWVPKPAAMDLVQIKEFTKKVEDLRQKMRADKIYKTALVSSDLYGLDQDIQSCDKLFFFP